MNLGRIARHLVQHHWRVRQVFPPPVLERIGQAIRQGETTHAGQVRFVVEGTLGDAALLRGQPARERALEVFSQLRIWDTERNNGVLIYLLLADRDVEIVADRGIHAQVGDAVWAAICRAMQAEFTCGAFERGVIGGVEAVSRELARHFPPCDLQRNELPDEPVVL